VNLGVAVHTVVLGAGPGGLAVAYRLAKAALNPFVLERAAFAGGLLRTLVHNGFFLDIGRKELYSRNPIVHRFCTEILGHHYRTYPRRFASLYRGRVVEQSGAYRGPLRGLPLGTWTRIAADLVVSRIRHTFIRPKTFEAWMYGGVPVLHQPSQHGPGPVCGPARRRRDRDRKSHHVRYYALGLGTARRPSKS